jgi:ubiquinone/menaquinone biosynthesis C-methylase UbiE
MVKHMETKELQKHFNEVASGGSHASYEERRWQTDPKVAEQARATQDFIKRIAIPLARNAHMITELGPGPGTWTRLLGEAAPKANFLLIDISGEMLRRAKTVLPETANVELLESEFLGASLPENKAELFFSSRALEYVEPKQLAVAHIVSHLIQGGEGVIITKTPKTLLNRLSGRKPSVLHSSQIRPSALRALFVEADCYNVRLHAVTFSVPIVRSAKLDRLVAIIFGRLPLNPLSAFLTESYAVTFTKA